ncbi:MAG: uroporphyrinogen-III synthase [Thaumarchaeota archaeon]|nr:uroporphyrinogen-III synthase [Nitrososphaerota archaeon]
MTDRPRAKKALITRTHEGNLELAGKLRAIGLEPISVDVLALAPPEDWSQVDERLREIDGYDWLLFTSAAGARFFAERARTLAIASRDGQTKIAAVGAKTASALAEAGWKVDFTPGRFTTRALAEELPGGGKVLLLRTEIADRTLGEVMRRRGFEVDEVAIYRTLILDLEAIEPVSEADMVIFGSPSAVEGICSQLPESVMSGLVEKEAACLGPVTAEAARAHGFTRIIQCVDENTFDSLLREIMAVNHLA